MSTELRELIARATDLPWAVRTLENFGFNIVHYVGGDKFNIKRVAKVNREEDADLIAAVNALPDLLTELETLRARVREAEAEIEAAIGHMLNANIDLETGRTKRAAIGILDRGMKRARAFLGGNDEG